VNILQKEKFCVKVVLFKGVYIEIQMFKKSMKNGDKMEKKVI
jgi:hypothetical protein